VVKGKDRAAARTPVVQIEAVHTAGTPYCTAEGGEFIKCGACHYFRANQPTWRADFVPVWIAKFKAPKSPTMRPEHRPRFATFI
jgi:hypothetical protein